VELDSINIDTDSENVIGIAVQVDPIDYANTIERLLGARGYEEIKLAARNRAVLTAISSYNILRRRTGLDFDIEHDIVLGQSRIEHRDPEKKWYYRDEILLTVRKLTDADEVTEQPGGSR
jgi:DNA-binding protein